MDQRARRIQQIIADAALGGSRPGLVPFPLGRPAPPRARRRTMGWALLSGLLLALPLLLPQDGGIAASHRPLAEREPFAPPGPGQGIWKFSAARADSEPRVMELRIAGGVTVPDGRSGTSDTGPRDFPVY